MLATWTSASCMCIMWVYVCLCLCLCLCPCLCLCLFLCPCLCLCLCVSGGVSSWHARGSSRHQVKMLNVCDIVICYSNDDRALTSQNFSQCIGRFWDHSWSRCCCSLSRASTCLKIPLTSATVRSPSTESTRKVSAIWSLSRRRSSARCRWYVCVRVCVREYVCVSEWEGERERVRERVQLDCVRECNLIPSRSCSGSHCRR